MADARLATEAALKWHALQTRIDRLHRLTEALARLSLACTRLDEAWEASNTDVVDILVEGYPFDRDFSEVEAAVGDWFAAANNKIFLLRDALLREQALLDTAKP